MYGQPFYEVFTGYLFLRENLNLKPSFEELLSHV